MKEIILFYKRSFQQIQKSNFQIEEELIKYKKIANILLNNLCDNELLKNKLYKAIQEGNFEKIQFYSQTIISNDGLIYVLNKKDKTAFILSSCNDENYFIEIPESIYHFYEKFTVTKILKKAFKGHLFAYIGFSNNSKLIEIQKSSFLCARIVSIVIPKSVKKIGKKAFYRCQQLQTVLFEKNSELDYIGESAFEGSPIKNFSIPSNFIEFKDDWCAWINDLFELNVSPSSQNCIILYENNYWIMKSDPKSDIFDILLFARRNIKRATIPPSVRIISKNAFQCCQALEDVEFSDDSELKIIESNAFSFSSIKKLIIPSCVEKFETEWRNETNNFSSIIILPSKKENIMCYQNKMILGKTDLNSEIFDVIVFAYPDIEEVTIPSSIKIIGSNAFEECKLKNITFSEDSELISIEQYAFQRSKLTSISIPAGVTRLNTCTFVECEDLINIEIPINSELREFGKSSLYWTAIRSLYIPSKLREFQSEWCDNTSSLNSITISPKNDNFAYFDEKYMLGKSDPSSSIYDVLIFSRRDIVNPIIPSFIKRIASCAFNFCGSIKTVIFSKNSNLEVIEEDAFSCSSLIRIKIPSSVKEIKHSAFAECFELKIFEFEENSQMRTIESFIFHNTKISSFIFPPHLTQIDDELFFQNDLEIIEISEDSELKTLSKSIFVVGFPKLIMVPAKIGNDFNLID